MSQLPSMPMYWGDYWSKTRRLSPAEHHAYLFLIGATWMNNGEPLPDDDRVLAAEIGIPIDDWLLLRPTVQRFFTITDGFWQNAKLTEVWSGVMRKVEANKTNGKRGGRPKIQQNQCHEKPTGFISVNPELTQPKPNQSQNQTKDSVPDGTALIDPVAVLFRRGLALLIESGLENSKARMMIGQWRKNNGDTQTMAAIVAAEKKGTPDPLRYIIAFLNETRKKGFQYGPGDEIAQKFGITPQQPGSGG